MKHSKLVWAFFQCNLVLASATLSATSHAGPIGSIEAVGSISNTLFNPIDPETSSSVYHFGASVQLSSSVSCGSTNVTHVFAIFPYTTGSTITDTGFINHTMLIEASRRGLSVEFNNLVWSAPYGVCLLNTFSGTGESSFYLFGE